MWGNGNGIINFPPFFVNKDLDKTRVENQIDNNISYYDDKGSNYSKMNYSFKQRYKDAYIKELDYMYKMIVNDYEPLIKENHLILTKKICNAINLSIKENKLIYLKN